jgi:hypothetical protein
MVGQACRLPEALHRGNEGALLVHRDQIRVVAKTGGRQRRHGDRSPRVARRFKRELGRTTPPHGCGMAGDADAPPGA